MIAMPTTEAGVSADEIRLSLAQSFDYTHRRPHPFTHWTLANCLPRPAIREIIDLPIAAPDLHGVSGKRDLHNATRSYFDTDTQGQFPITRAVAEALQDHRITQQIERTFDVHLGGSWLRIEYAQDVDGFHLEPHTDLGVKLFTFLIYLDGGSSMGTDVYAADKSWAARAPAHPGHGLVFIPAANTWHGFERRPIEGVRRSLIVNYVTGAWKAREQLAFPDRLPIDSSHATATASTRYARTVLMMPGAAILQAKDRPVKHRGQWVQVVD
jgi:hypothetical protein